MVMTILTMGFAFVAMIAGIFGMNLSPLPVEDDYVRPGPALCCYSGTVCALLDSRLLCCAAMLTRACCALQTHFYVVVILSGAIGFMLCAGALGYARKKRLLTFIPQAV
jgi:Mg2+ and Co2+ transporter CorA